MAERRNPGRIDRERVGSRHPHVRGVQAEALELRTFALPRTTTGRLAIRSLTAVQHDATDAMQEATEKGRDGIDSDIQG